MAKAIGKLYTRFRDWLFPAPAIELLVGQTGVAPYDSGYGSVLFPMRAPLFVQQMLHENDPGGVQTFALDVWVRIPEDHYAVLAPNLSAWTGGRLLPLAHYLRPGWSGELSITVFNSHPSEVAGLPTGAPGFELILAPTTGRAWITDKT